MLYLGIHQPSLLPPSSPSRHSHQTAEGASSLLEVRTLALAGLAQRLERQLRSRETRVRFPLRARTSVAVCPRPWLDCAGVSHSMRPFHVDVSLSLSSSLSLPLCLNKKNGKMSSGEDKKKIIEVRTLSSKTLKLLGQGWGMSSPRAM
uniref:Uncharacterized protein n=1 Tax=Molossus molossus TaxID=27622 RepID=A0A7J8GRA8_MOLMO|nr:hypothetical protein HJG59_011253 [Molossus molossus]